MYALYVLCTSATDILPSDSLHIGMDPTGGTRSTSMLQEDHEAGSVNDILTEALRHGHQILYLNYKCLTQIPTALCQTDDDGQGLYRHVERLYMKCNLLTSLPPELSRLSGLKELYIISNSLPTLPDAIADLPNLTSLNVSQNVISSLPASIGRCPCLQTLVLSNNYLKQLPIEIGLLKSLQILIANDNELNQLPNKICGCINLKSINVDRNKFKTLPRELSCLVHLEEVSAQGNHLLYLPMDLGCCTDALQSVHVNNNPHLEAVPFNLWKKQIGASGCGTSPMPESDRMVMTRVSMEGMSALLPPEIKVVMTTDERRTFQVPSLLEIALKFANSVLGQSRYATQEILDTLPKDLARRVRFPISNCSAPNGCDKKIFSQAWVHLLKIKWAQSWQEETNSIGFVALLCSQKCYKIFKRVPIPV